MASGVKCNQTCLDAFEELKLRKTYRYILFHISDDKEIRVLEKADRSATYQDFLGAMMQAVELGDGRYAVLDFEYPGKTPTLFFIAWNPTSLSVRKKMIYAASKDAIRKRFVGIKHEVQANELDDILEEEFIKKLH